MCRQIERDRNRMIFSCVLDSRHVLCFAPSCGAVMNCASANIQTGKKIDIAIA
jgi:hypothetical protein